MNSFPSKLLLFGEYTIIQGSQALAIPFSTYSGQWQYGGDAYDLNALAAYLSDLQSQEKLLAPLDVAALTSALSKGLNFESNIPTGYGLGSSGAVCAAIYQIFKSDSRITGIPQLRQILAQIESFFHGASSGIDPLVSYLKQGIWIKSKSEIEVLNESFLENTTDAFFLIDTKISRSTAPLVQYFKEQYTESRLFQEAIQAELIPANHQAINAFLQHDSSALFENVHLISQVQYRHFQKMIPIAFRDIWEQGIESDSFKLKLCGAGGGGFILGLTKDFAEVQEQLAEFSIQPIKAQVSPIQSMRRIF